MKKSLLLICFLALASFGYGQSVTPIVNYITNMGGGIYGVTYGYTSTYSTTQNIPVSTSGNKNYFNPSPNNRSQPTTFQPGTFNEVFTLYVSYGSTATWNLTTKSVGHNTKNISVTQDDGTSVMPVVGSTIEYKLDYYNYENTNLSSGVLYDTLPAGTSFVSCTNGGTHSNGVVTWNLGTVNKNSSGWVYLTLQVTSIQPIYKNKFYMAGTMSSYNRRAYSADENTPAVARVADSTYMVAFEDLKGSGWNDWDVNDFVVGMRERVNFNNSNGISQIVFDYEALARGSAFVNKFSHLIKVIGNSTATLVVKDSNGTTLPALGFTNQNFSGNINIPIFPNTYNALPPRAGLAFTNVENVQSGVVKGYKATLTITTDPTKLNSGNYLRNSSLPYLVNELNKQIDIASIAGTLGNTQNVDNNVDVTTQLYGYFLDLGYRLPYDWKWPLEGPPSAMWKSFPDFTPYMLSSRVSNLDWYESPNLSLVWTRRNVLDNAPYANTKANAFTKRLQNFQYNTDELIFLDSAGSFFASPKLADVDGDNKLEILIGSYDKKFHAYKTNGTEVPGFPVTTGGFIRSTAAVDLNSVTGARVIAFGSEDGKLYAVDKNGANLPGFPVQTPKGIKSSPVISDLNNDGQKEIVVLSGDGKLYAYSMNGVSLNGFPVQVQTTEDNFGVQIIMPSPAVVDLDGNGTKEIVLGTLDKNLKVINSDGTTKFTRTLDSAVYASPVIAKIHSSTYRIVLATAGGTIYVYDTNGGLVIQKNVGAGFVASPVIADINQDGDPKLIAATVTGEIFCIDAVTMNITWNIPTGQQIYSSPAIADIDGDNYLDMIFGGQAGFILPLTREGGLVDSLTMANIEPFDSWIISSAAIGDIDKDGKLDLVTASMDNKVKAFSLPGTTTNSRVWWSSFGNDLRNTRVSDSLTSVGVHNTSSLTADKYSLNQNYPNPFNPTTKISFSIAKNDFVSIKIFDMLGKQVAELVNADLKAGVYEYTFDGSNLSSGNYFYQIKTNNFVETKRMALLK